MSFDQFNFNPKIVDNIRACKYETPTPIQEQAIPVVLAGHDVLGLAQTGTGKTAAFVLPMLEKMIKGPRRKPRALIIAPTRELAEQIHVDIETMAARTGIHSITVYGGVSKFAQTKQLRQGVEIIVACPGRLLDHLADGNVNLSQVEILVLDEADHMFDMGFLPVIRRIIKHLPKERQNLLFSATMPAEIRKLSAEILRNPRTVQIDHDQPKDTVTHLLFTVEQDKKTALLKNIIAKTEMGPTLIFTRTKYRAKNLAVQLQKAGLSATSLHGNLSQSKRQQSLEGFKNGKFKYMVATDIAARGIDVSAISHVINFDVPDTVEAYTHRIGRTGRAECTGEAYIFASRDDRKMIKMIESSFGKRFPHSDMAGSVEAESAKKAPRPPAKKKAGQQNSRPKKQTPRSAEGKKSGARPQTVHKKEGSRQKRRGRAAQLSDDSENIFL